MHEPEQPLLLYITDSEELGGAESYLQTLLLHADQRRYRVGLALPPRPATQPLVELARAHFARIVGLRRSESDAILEMLYRQVETPEISVRFKWQRNSIAFWDNRCAQHHALWDYYPHKRYGHRVTVCGQKPY